MHSRPEAALRPQRAFLGGGKCLARINFVEQPNEIETPDVVHRSLAECRQHVVAKGPLYRHKTTLMTRRQTETAMFQLSIKDNLEYLLMLYPPHQMLMLTTLL